MTPEKTKTIAVLLAKLGAHYYRPDFGPEQVKHLTLDFMEDLAEFSTEDIAQAFTDYRRNPENRFFPTPGMIRHIANENIKERARNSRFSDRKPRFAEGRPNMWWALMPYLWRPHWRESEIPIEWIKTYQARKERKQAKGETGWSDDDFGGFYRKWGNAA